MNVLPFHQTPSFTPNNFSKRIHNNDLDHQYILAASLGMKFALRKVDPLGRRCCLDKVADS
jgi:hypothetical protein